MNRDPIVLILLAAILLTGVATTALLFEQRAERHRMATEARAWGDKLNAETDKVLKESEALASKLLKDMPKLPDLDPASDRKPDTMKELHCAGEFPNRKCDWR